MYKEGQVKRNWIYLKIILVSNLSSKMLYKKWVEMFLHSELLLLYQIICSKETFRNIILKYWYMTIFCQLSMRVI